MISFTFRFGSGRLSFFRSRPQGKHFVKDDRFCLRDLLELELYKFGEDVDYIAELAKKEAQISSQLEKIEAKWQTLSLRFGRTSKRKDLDMIDRSVTRQCWLFLLLVCCVPLRFRLRGFPTPPMMNS